MSLTILKWMETDPFFSCKLHLKQNCTNVCTPLCDFETCLLRKEHDANIQIHIKHC
jgi:hypothetical protein